MGEVFCIVCGVRKYASSMDIEMDSPGGVSGGAVFWKWIPPAGVLGGWIGWLVGWSWVINARCCSRVVGWLEVNCVLYVYTSAYSCVV